MKRTILSTLCLAALTCAAQSNAPTLASSYNDFAFDFFQHIESEHVDENIILSPLSAQFALSMLQNGAGGHTLTEIQQALHTAGYSLDDINRYNRALIDRLKAEPQIADWEREEYAAIGKDPRDNFARVEIANGIWVRNDLPTFPEFFATNANYYDASAEAVDFATPETYARLDQWAYDHTHSLIPSFGLDPDNPDRAMVLANTLYFESPWAGRFYGCQKAYFTNADGSRQWTDLMHNCFTGWYYHTDNFKMHRLYYGVDSRFCMNLFLPHTADARLTVDEWRQLQTSDEEAIIDFYMPKFCIEDNIKLVDVLKGMGMNDAFAPGVADFSPISPVELCVSDVYHKARIEVDEEGTAAAALTVVDIDAAEGEPDEVTKEPLRVEIRLDRPFYFTIEDCADHSILFMGHITDLAELERRAGQQEGIDTVLATRPTSQRTYDLQGRLCSEAHEGEGPAANGQRRITICDGRKAIR